MIIATIAFGMGLDSPYVRAVIHWGPSEIIEDYVQGIGTWIYRTAKINSFGQCPA